MQKPQFNSFELGDICDHFDHTKTSEWKKLNKFIVASAAEYHDAMEQQFDFYDISSEEYDAFDAGVEYTLDRVNKSLKAAGIALEICSTDLGDGMGFVLVRTDDTPESFVKRALKKPVLKVDSWL